MLTVSSSRFGAARRGKGLPDESGDAAVKGLRKLGHTVTYRGLVSDEKGMVRKEVEEFLRGGEDMLLTTGGTGVSPRDITIEAVTPFFEKELEGFGELFRAESYKIIGAAATLSRATAGVAKGRLLICLPGSPQAVELAIKTFGKEFPHAVFIARG